jgi:hypothetical protein
MARKKQLVHKIGKKKNIGKCKFCSCDQYEVLDIHRIIEGKDGGIYSDWNTVVCCASCHRKIHAGLIKIDRHYPTISGKMILHYWLDGVEHWD